eukprot:scaffold248407_cov17-Prasinocladus_malaysianus.AAC.1
MALQAKQQAAISAKNAAIVLASLACCVACLKQPGQCNIIVGAGISLLVRSNTNRLFYLFRQVFPQHIHSNRDTDRRSQGAVMCSA